MPAQYVLYESASGYALLDIVEAEEIGALKAEVQASVTELARFSKIVKLKAFQPFTSAENALQNINDISEGIVTSDLKAFLEANLPPGATAAVKPGKSPKFLLGVLEPKIGTSIQEALGVHCNTNETIAEIVRGVRLHFTRYVEQLGNGNLEKAQLGLAHSYSRAKVKFNVHRADNMIIQAIALLDTLDKDLNTFAMRVREWYGWHFPELARLVKDNFIYARLAQFIGDRSTLDESKLEGMTDIIGEPEEAAAVLSAARSSMGMDISASDLSNVELFTSRLVSLAQYRAGLSTYLSGRMAAVAPNLSALIGDVVGARLISHAGSLTNLAKAPASTVQILGAEKALFRALKTKGNTPKYGLIFHSSFIGRAAAKNKGRISRYLANKASIASRIDSFSDGAPTSKFGDRLREQVEDRLKFYETGEAPKRNLDVMHSVIAELKAEGIATGFNDADADAEGAAASSKKSKKSKSEKKSKREAEDVDAVEAAPADAVSAKKRRRASDAGYAVTPAPPAPEASAKKVKSSSAAAPAEAAPAAKSEKKAAKSEKKEKKSEKKERRASVLAEDD